MDPQFFERLLATFQLEADEHLKNISSGLISLENTEREEDRKEQLEFIYREAHSLKGAARAVSFQEIEGICQNIENIFSGLKKSEIKPSQAVYDLLHEGIDAVTEYLSAQPESRPRLVTGLMQLNMRIEDFTFTSKRINFVHSAEIPSYENPGRKSSSPVELDENDIESIRRMRDSLAKQSPATPEPAISEPAPVLPPVAKTEDIPAGPASPEPAIQKRTSDDLFRVSFGKLDHLYSFGEELLTSKIRFEQIQQELSESLAMFSHLRKEWRYHNARQSVLRSRLLSSNTDLTREEQQSLHQFSEFTEWNHSYLAKIEGHLSAIQKAAQFENKALNTQVEGILGTLREMLILPFSHLTDMLPKMTRDIAHELGKEIELNIRGAEIEVEKRILDSFRDPLIHLIRNAIDHGIESPALRVENGKPAKGKISLTITQSEAAHVCIELQDDGAGLKLDAIKRSAIKRNVISEIDAPKLSDEETFDLIFRSGVTTAPVITDISGRGLGMAIVKEKIEKVNGSVTLTSKENEGSLFRITLPVTIAAQRAITIRCNDRIFQLPATYLQKVVRLQEKDISIIEGKSSFQLGKLTIPIVHLADLLGLGKAEEVNSTHVQVAVLTISEDTVAFAFNELLDEQEIVIKPFNRQLQKIRNIAGANLTAGGKIIPILDANDLMRSAKELLTGEISVVHGEVIPDKKQKHILVADDSITSRMLMKDILESAGYLVSTATDGVDALMQLRTTDYDIVVSDVEMPRMNGFDLTKGIRENTKTADLPVVLVTGLSKREDKERGIEAGANAYIVKSSFNQANLLEIIDRLIS